MFHPFPGVEFRGDLVRRLLRMSENREIQNLRKFGDKVAQHRLIQMRGGLTVGRMQSIQHTFQIPGGHTVGPKDSLQFRLRLTAFRQFHLFFYCQQERGNVEPSAEPEKMGGVTLHVFNK